MALLYCVQNIRKPQNGRGSTQIGGIKYVYNNYSDRLIHNRDVCEEQEDRILNIDSQERRSRIWSVSQFSEEDWWQSQSEQLFTECVLHKVLLNVGKEELPWQQYWLLAECRSALYGDQHSSALLASKNNRNYMFIQVHNQKLDNTRRKGGATIW